MTREQRRDLGVRETRLGRDRDPRRAVTLQPGFAQVDAFEHGAALAPALARIDGNQPPTLDCGIELIVGGDAIEPCISAASILAKTERDADLVQLHALSPAYGFERHKGYPTAVHLELLRRLGPCEAHRRSFAPVRAAMAAGMPR